jgi:hypothetical protein
MKKTRLLEIIREEIASALSEETNVTTTNAKGETDVLPYNTPADKLEVARLKKDSNIKSIKTTAGQKIKEEKRKKLAEKYQLDEETINEMASIKQLKSELEKQGKEKELRAVSAAEKSTLDTLKKDPTITSDGRLKGYVSALKKELKAEHNINLQDLLTTVMLDAEEAGGKFKDDIATNTIEKDAANQLLGKEPGQRGRKADPNKPEKAAPTGKKGRPAGTKKATLTPGDDGFDKVTYSDDSDEEVEDTYYNDEDEFSSDDTEGPSSKDISGDETAKELGQASSVSKDENFDRIRTGLMNKAKKAKGELSSEDRKLAAQIINTAKAKYKFNATQVDALRAVAGL